MRRLAAAAIAAPVIATMYLVAAWQRPSARRFGAAGLVAVVIAAGALVLASPRPSSSVPPTPTSPLLDSQFVPLAASAPGASEPPAGELPADLAMVRRAAAIAGPSLRIPAPRATLTTSRPGRRLPLNGAFVIQLTRPVATSELRASLTITPRVKGRLAPAPGDKTNQKFVFTPSRPLAPNTAYTIALTGSLSDLGGTLIKAPRALRILTIPSPRVVRTRPAAKTTGVDQGVVISVRFSQPMNTAATNRAFGVYVAGKRLAGKIRWAEGRTVLVFDPAKPLRYSAGVGVRIGGTARSADGAPLGHGSSFTFTVMPKPVAAPVAKSRTRPRSGSGSPGSGGGASVGGGPWAAAELYYLRLMNCTRTGGSVTPAGTCDSPGGRDVAPLRLDQDISDRVTRPYARYVVTNDICTHFADGNPGHRLARAGYTSPVWAENMSCPQSMSVEAAMLHTQLFFQSEKPYRGGHYVNLMNPEYDRVGIGVWVVGGRVEVVVDFYHP